MKKPLSLAVLYRFAFAFILVSVPFFAYAGIRSIFFGFFGTQASAQPIATQNSQTLPLLASIATPNPSATGNQDDISVVSGDSLMADTGPVGSVVDANIEATQNGKISVYTVHAGDTISGIAKMYGVTSNTIIWANDIKGGLIHEGQTLTILPITGVQYTTVKGDTLTSIAKKFKADSSDIAEYNGLDASSPIAVGTSLIIPNGEMASPIYYGGGSKGLRAEPYLGGSGPDLGSYYLWPVAGGVITQSLHGWNGIDIGAPKGTSIYAAAAGTVIVARSNGGWNGGYGNYVVILHSNGTQTLYGHASAIFVSVGDSVSQGQTIAAVGKTGMATGYHLHFEVRGAKNPFASMRVGSGE